MRRFLLIIFLFSAFGRLAAQYTYNGTAIQLECNKHRLTQAINTQLGSVWYQTKIDLNQSFDFTFDVSLSSITNDGGADGLVFVLQNNGLNAIGTGGGGIGYETLPGNSLGIEIDTWPNSAACPGDRLDPALDHIGILKNGSTFHCSTNSLASPVVVGTNGNIEDGQPHVFRVVWNATVKIITVYFDGALVISKGEDMVNTIFGGNPMVYWGFTGSTGGANNVQWFKTILQAGIFTTLNLKCESESQGFTSISESFFPIAKFYWYFDDGSPVDSINNAVAHHYTAGSHTTKLKIIDINGCADSTTRSEFIHPKPVAHFTWVNTCVGVPIQFNDSSYFTVNDQPPGLPLSNYWWRMPDGSTYNSQNVTYTFALPGQYTIYHVSYSFYSCKSDTVQYIINVQPAAVANFTFQDNSCIGNSVQFTDASSIASGTITSWNWNFGDGGTSILKNPAHVFTTPGPHDVTLIVNGGSCSNSITLRINIVPLPIAYFKNSSRCQFAPVTFTDSSYTIGGSAITGWWWDLGNGQFSSNQNPTTTYAVTGSVQVRLVVTNANGCLSDTFTRSITINAKPVAKFVYSDSCVQNTIQFSDASTATGSAITYWYWDLGNGTTSFLLNPVTTYTTNGFKTIKLFVKSQEGCESDTLIRPIHIFSRPNTDFTFSDSVCLGSPMLFFGTSTWADGVLNGWSWDFGDATPPVMQQNPSHIFSAPGVYTVTLTNNGIAAGCAGVKQKNVFVVNKPIAYFKTTTACQFSQTSLQDSSYTTDGAVVTGWWWDLGNGSFSNQKNPIVTYLLGGQVTIKHVVYNSKGCISDTAFLTINIAAKPIANFGFSNLLCDNIAVQFSDSSLISNGTVLQWNWINKGISFSSLQNPSQVFASGVQTIKLVATGNSGCVSDTAVKTFSIGARPDISMFFVNACRQTPVSFTATDNLAIGIANWKWTFGDGATGNGSPAQHSYPSNGIYPVTLVAVSNAGCTSDIQRKNITIYSTKAFAGNDTIAAAGQPIQLNGSGGVNYEWSPATGLNDPFLSNPIAILTQTQQYILKAFTPQGCITFDTVLIKIFKGPEIYLPNAFTPNGDGFNDVLRGIPIGIKDFRYLKIYNRWGQELYSTTDYRKGWNGEYKGQKQENGAYVVIASGIDFNGNAINKKGSVILIR
jgi:gliding motility-associated-like protein